MLKSDKVEDQQRQTDPDRQGQDKTQQDFFQGHQRVRKQEVVVGPDQRKKELRCRKDVARYGQQLYRRFPGDEKEEQ